jgi:simple sugar transport system permease protein
MSGTEDSILTAILVATIIAGTPLIITALGELITERAGVLNLGAEGMMAVGAIAGFAAAHHTGSAAMGALAGLAAGALMALIFAILTLTLLANQVASGLALSIFGVGLSAFIGKPYESVTLAAVPTWRIPLLADIPVLGPAIFNQQALVYASWALFGGIVWFLYRTRPGLLLRAVGESPASAHSIGYPVIRIRYLATLFGGAMAGVGGAFLSVFYTPLWVEGMVSGRGWIALALVVFATWRPLRVLVGAYLFGGVMIAQLFLQGSGAEIEIPSQFLSSLPYWATIIVLVVISRNVNTIRLNSPASLGQPYRPDG